jgi:hypothetical protein
LCTCKGRNPGVLNVAILQAMQWATSIVCKTLTVPLSCGQSCKRWGKILWVAVSCGENCTLLALFIFSTKMFKMCALFLWHSVLFTFLPFPRTVRRKYIDIFSYNTGIVAPKLEDQYDFRWKMKYCNIIEITKEV